MTCTFVEDAELVQHSQDWKDVAVAQGLIAGCRCFGGLQNLPACCSQVVCQPIVLLIVPHAMLGWQQHRMSLTWLCSGSNCQGAGTLADPPACNARGVGFACVSSFKGSVGWTKAGVRPRCCLMLHTCTELLHTWLRLLLVAMSLRIHYSYMMTHCTSSCISKFCHQFDCSTALPCR